MGIYKSWADGETIGSKLPINLSSGKTNNVGQQLLSSTKYFQATVVMDGRNSITQPSQIPGCCAQSNCKPFHN